MAYSPSGIFVGLSTQELAELKASALRAITSGQWTSITGGQKTGSKQYQMRPQDVLEEVKFAEQSAGIGRPRAQKITQILSKDYCRRG